MSRTAITVTDVSRSKTEQPSQQSGTTEMKIGGNDSRVILEIESTSAAVTIEVPIPTTVDGDEVKPKKYEVAKEETIVVGPFPAYIYNQTDGTVLVDASGTTYKIRAYHV